MLLELKSQYKTLTGEDVPGASRGKKDKKKDEKKEDKKVEKKKEPKAAKKSEKKAADSEQAGAVKKTTR